MIDAGYFPKRIELRPESLNASTVREICSVSQCISCGPSDWVERWVHNELGWCNRVEDARRLIPAGQEAAYRMFAYRIHPERFVKGIPVPFVVPLDVKVEPITDAFQRLGFDSVNKSMESVLGLECSPLSCNAMAAELQTNEYCLFSSFVDALAGAVRFSLEQPEPGDYYIVEVLEAQHAA